tara:strand:- start:1144 stop:3015 length:1872 start_codon:yes stop_codon:yes gene_type:complete
MSQTLITVPLCHLQRSRTNVRKTQPKENIEELAASIAAHGLLQNLTVRALNADDKKTEGAYEVVAGGRRLAALKLLARRKRIAKDAPVLCLLLDGDDAVEISLAENMARVPLHPADQFEAFSKLHAEGMSIEDIAARFGVSDTIVRQRLKLAAVSPKLMAVYREGDMGLDQLVAFTITDDREAQERVWFDAVPYNRHPQAIRRALTKALVEATDRRARFVGSAVYEAAGGVIVRDLFDPEDGGYFADSILLDRLVAEKLVTEAKTLKQEGWAWVETMVEVDYDGLPNFRRVPPDIGGLTEEEDARLETLCEQHDAIVTELDDDPSEEIAAELDRIATEIDALSERRQQWSDEVKATAGAMVSLDYGGLLSIVRGLAKPDERDTASSGNGSKKRAEGNGASSRVPTLSEALLEDLSAHRTAALRETLAGHPDVALTVLLHSLVLRIFYGASSELCVDIRPASLDLFPSTEGIAETKAFAALSERQQRLSGFLPEVGQLWGWLCSRSDSLRSELLAYCVAVTVNAVRRRQLGIDPERQAQSDLIAEAVGLDMADWWEPTRDSYFSRVPKALILSAVSEAVSSQAAENIERLKKDAMALRAEELLAGKRWLPEPLRKGSALAEAAE